MTGRLLRASGPAALVISIMSLVASASGVSLAGRGHKSHAKGGHHSSAVVAHARNADRLGGRKASAFQDSCNADSVDLGTWCLWSAPYSLANSEVGKNNYFFATQKCVSMGGWLPTAAELVGAADRVKLESTIDDNQTTAIIDIDPSDGLKDQREMSSTLVTTAAGSSAAGSEGVTPGSTGNPREGEPNPAPEPADPAPDTLQYVTVYDNHNHGGFAGSLPVNAPLPFRCAFNKKQHLASGAL